VQRENFQLRSDQVPEIYETVDLCIEPEWYRASEKMAPSENKMAEMVLHDVQSCYGKPADIGSNERVPLKRRMQSVERWRREWDSNPRYGFPYTRFPSVRLKPLGHPSGTVAARAI
jgi:hypothetical protein